MKRAVLAGLALMLTSVSLARSPGGQPKEVRTRWPVLAERQLGDETAGRVRALLDGARRGDERGPIVTFGPRSAAQVLRLDRGTDYKLRVIEPPRGVDHKIVLIRPDPNVDYKLRILGPKGRDVYRSPLTNGRKTIILDPNCGGRRE